ncbi:MAG: hypothetical protein VYC34_01735, partial [Planctomycetota bacterium]|nr:hypothetical protein [Planctomycetota bacterium]
DPEGLYEIAIVRQGRDRIEVSMPLPTEEVKRLQQNYQDALQQLDDVAIDADRLDRVMRLPAAERAAALREMAAGNEERLALLEAAASRYDDAQAARESFDEARAQEGVDQETLDELVQFVADAVVAFDEARAAVLQSSVTGAEIERALSLPNEERRIRDDSTGEVEILPSPRQVALDNLRERYPEASDEIEGVLQAFDAYASKRRGLDDVNDLKRLLRGAGVLNFRIAVEASEGYPDEQRVRRELQERGPRAVRAADVRWLPVQDISSWYDSVQQLRSLQANPAAFFRARDLVGEEYNGLYYILVWDTDDLAMTQADGEWRVSRAFPSTDQFGRACVAFQMDARGGSLLGRLTGPNTGRPMAVVLDDQVYTAPNLQSRISSNGQIVGNFSPSDINYLVRTLNAGALAAKLQPQPISEEVLGPTLGADNLRKGFTAGIIALVAVAVFMVMYYLGAGVIAVIALLCNAIIILGAMSLNRAAFTLPGIAGVILTFGMAVDANVLIYERIR